MDAQDAPNIDQDFNQNFNEENPPVESLAGEAGELNKEDTLNSRLQRYAPLKNRNLDMVDYIQTLPLYNQKRDLLKVMSECGNFLLFHHYFEKQEVRLHKASFCKNHLLCPLCGLRRGSKATQAYDKRFKLIKEKYPDIEPYFVTLTVKDGPDLRERIGHLQACRKEYTNIAKDAKRGRRPLTELNKALGGVSSYEIKRGKDSGLWHPHSHEVWLCKERPYQSKIQEEWRSITGDSFIVDARPIDKQKQLEGFLEVFTYALKTSTMTLKDQYDAAQVLRGKRLINSWGLFRGVKIPENLEDDPLTDEPYIEMLFQFMRKSGYNFITSDPRRP